MSQENVEIVRRTLDAFNRRDFDAWLEGFDRDVVWYAFPDEPDQMGERNSIIESQFGRSAYRCRAPLSRVLVRPI